MTKKQESPDKQVDNRETSSSKQEKDGRGKSAGTKSSLEQYQWAKGESGNPSGRPSKNKWLRFHLKEFGAEKPLSNLNTYNDFMISHQHLRFRGCVSPLLIC